MIDLPIGDPVAPIDEVPAPAHRVLEGRYIHLVPSAAGDADELYPGSHGDAAREALWTYLPYGPFADLDAMRTWTAECATSTDPQFYCVRCADTGAARGMVSFLRIEPPHRCLEIGHIWYLPAAQRTRANTEAAYLLMEEAFGVGNRRLEWKCDSLNARSRTAALRLGFTFEGVFRQHRIVRNRNRDTAWFALLDADWPRVRDNLRRWLYHNDDGRLSLTQLQGAA